MLLKIILGMRGNHSSGRGRESHQTNRGRGIQQFFNGTNPTTLPQSHTSAEESLPSEPPIGTSSLDTHVSQGTNIPSSSNAAPVANMN